MKKTKTYMDKLMKNKEFRAITHQRNQENNQ